MGPLMPVTTCARSPALNRSQFGVFIARTARVSPRSCGDFNYRVLRFVFFRLALADFNFRLVRLVSMYEASVSAAIDMILFGEVVLVNESPPHARNADKNPLWISFFSFALCQWPIPNIAFQLGSFPGTVSVMVIRVRSRWRGAGVRRCAVFPAVTTLPYGCDP